MMPSLSSSTSLATRRTMRRRPQQRLLYLIAVAALGSSLFSSSCYAFSPLSSNERSRLTFRRSPLPLNFHISRSSPPSTTRRPYASSTSDHDGGIWSKLKKAIPFLNNNKEKEAEQKHRPSKRRLHRIYNSFKNNNKSRYSRLRNFFGRKKAI